MTNRWQRSDAPRGDDYDARWRSLAAAGQNVHGEADLVEALLESGGTSVLDAGCGTGRVAIELAERGLAVTGVDADPGMLARRARRPGQLDPRPTCRPRRGATMLRPILLAGNVMIFLEPGSGRGCHRALKPAEPADGLLVSASPSRPRRLSRSGMIELAAGGRPGTGRAVEADLGPRAVRRRRPAYLGAPPGPSKIIGNAICPGALVRGRSGHFRLDTRHAGEIVNEGAFEAVAPDQCPHALTSLLTAATGRRSRSRVIAAVIFFLRSRPRAGRSGPSPAVGGRLSTCSAPPSPAAPCGAAGFGIGGRPEPIGRPGGSGHARDRRVQCGADSPLFGVLGAMTFSLITGYPRCSHPATAGADVNRGRRDDGVPGGPRGCPECRPGAGRGHPITWSTSSPRSPLPGWWSLLGGSRTARARWNR